MDSLTHIVLGACIGEVMMDRKAGRKAMLWGALAQSVPDIDFIAGAWMPLTSELLAHRGFTHSFLFAGIISFFLALIASRWHKAEPISFRKWMVFFLVEIFTHLFLDAMNNYGIGWLEPFSEKRFAFHVMYVADPLFTLIPLIAFFFLLFLKMDHLHRMRWARSGIIASSFYLALSFFNKQTVQRAVENSLNQSNRSNATYFTTPTLLNNLLWMVVVKDSTGFLVTQRSVFDKSDLLQWNYIDQNTQLLDPVHDHQEVMELKKFSQGYYTVEHWGDTLVFNDLRFGQQNGWEDPKSRFSFHYYISHPSDNELIVQRGRFALLNAASGRRLLTRMLGEQSQ